MTSLVLPPRQVNRFGSAYFEGPRAVILSATKPTVRPAEVGGGALVTGDIWVDTTAGERWICSPGYWLLTAPHLTVVHSNISATFSTIITTLSSGANQFFPSHPATNSAMVFSARASVIVVSTNDANSYWEFGPKLRAMGGSAILMGGGTITDLASVANSAAESVLTVFYRSWTINTLVSNYRGQGFAFNAVKAGSTGTPGNMAITGTLSYAYALAI